MPESNAAHTGSTNCEGDSATGRISDSEAAAATASAPPQLDILTLFDAANAAEQADLEEQIRQHWIEYGMPAELSYSEGVAWAEQAQSAWNSADVEWREKVIRLEAHVEARCRERMLAAGFQEQELQGSHVPCLPKFVAADDPRYSAFREAMEALKADERTMVRALHGIHAGDSGGDLCEGSSDEPDLVVTEFEGHHASSQDSGASAENRSIPHWDKELSELSFAGRTRPVRRIAKNVIKVLDAFEELGWPIRIDDPLPRGADGMRLRTTVRQLNTGRLQLQFRADGSGEGIRWCSMPARD